MKQTPREKDKQIVGLYKRNKSAQEISEVVGVSKRTVERKIRAYNEGEMPYCDNIAQKVSQWEKEEEELIFNMIKSDGYANIVKMGLESITQERIDKEYEKGGVRAITMMVGTLIDKRLKSSSVDLERANLKLKKELAANSRIIQFVGEEPVYEVDNQLPQNDTKRIS